MAPLNPALRAYADRGLAAPPAWEFALADLRAGPESESDELWGGPADEVAEVRDVMIEHAEGSLRARVYRPKSDGDLPGLVWLHGGGWVVGSIESHDHVCRAIAARTPCCVVALDYQLAPEHPFPAALDDAWAGLRWTRENAGELGIDPSRVAIGGDSAGGNLAAVTAIRARDAGVPLALQVLVYPVTDAQLESDSYAVHASGLNLTLEKMRWYWDQYLDGADPLDAQASPIMASDLSALAPALVQLAEYDPLCSEGQIYGQRLADAGVEATVTLYEGTIHGFLRMPALTGSADDALAQIAAALRSSGIRGVRSDGSLAV
jgi:acetyl esterase